MTGLSIPDNFISSFKTKLISVSVCREYYFHTETIGKFPTEMNSLPYASLKESSKQVFHTRLSDVAGLLYWKGFESDVLAVPKP